jgi:hypothetical protein
VYQETKEKKKRAEGGKTHRGKSNGARLVGQRAQVEEHGVDARPLLTQPARVSKKLERKEKHQGKLSRERLKQTCLEKKNKQEMFWFFV